MSEQQSSLIGNILAWWGGLPNQRAERALLRRAHSLTAIELCPAYHRAYQQICAGLSDSEAEKIQVARGTSKLALTLGVLVHVQGTATSEGRQQSGKCTAIAAMNAKKGEGNTVSELRFLRLLESPNPESLFAGMRRVVPLLGEDIDIANFARSLLYWGDKVKKDWAYAYDWPDHKSNN